MNIELKISGVKELSAELQAAIHQGAMNGLEKIGTRGAILVQDNIRTPYNGRPAAVATTHLLSSIFSEQQGVMHQVIAAGPPADVYSAAVETGTRPHFPPPSALLPWVKMKFNPPGEKEALSIAFAIAKNIAKRGTQGFFMFQRAFEILQGEAQGIFEREIATSIQAAGFGAH